MSFDPVGLPVTQQVPFRMDKVDSAQAWQGFGLQQSEHSFWHRHCSKLGRNSTGRKEPAKSQEEDCTRIAACAKAFQFEFCGAVQLSCTDAAAALLQKREAREYSFRLQRE